MTVYSKMGIYTNPRGVLRKHLNHYLLPIPANLTKTFVCMLIKLIIQSKSFWKVIFHSIYSSAYLIRFILIVWSFQRTLKKKKIVSYTQKWYVSPHPLKCMQEQDISRVIFFFLILYFCKKKKKKGTTSYPKHGITVTKSSVCFTEAHHW